VSHKPALGHTFRENPVCPCGDYPWEKYYWRRPRVVAFQFESDYWGKATDPDGKERKLLEERDRKVEDQKEEISFINSLKPGKILDVGCGPGFTLSGIDDRWQKHGTEISRKAASYAKKNGTIFLGELPAAGYRSDFFDVVLMEHVLRYVEEPIAYIREVKRILRGGGSFIVVEVDYDSGCARRFKGKYRMLHDEGSINLFTSFSLVKLLEDMNFTILKVEYPFFETRWFTKENLLRLFDTGKTSPPFWGNFVSVYAIKTVAGQDRD